ncbi:MAG: XTP/dITP diphosphatase [Candidatus Binatia bacterium]
MELLVGTTNSGKMREIQTSLADLNITLLSLASLVLSPRIVEDGDTYEENALKKARTLVEFSNKMSLADDSGLEAEALAGAPGVQSARYAGEPSSDTRNNDKLLRALAGVPREQRKARFVCVLALCAPPLARRKEWIFRAECEGWIAFAPKGDKGFGYDPIFFYPPLGKTFAELDQETKSQVSHRGNALKKLRERLPEILNQDINS